MVPKFFISFVIETIQVVMLLKVLLSGGTEPEPLVPEAFSRVRRGSSVSATGPLFAARKKPLAQSESINCSR